jgi:DNA-binding transcriptional regulator GbsR (MarR family)
MGAKQTQINEDLIRYFKENSSLKYLAFYVRIKTLYVNSVVYTYNPEKVAQGLGMTVNFVRKSVRELKKLGLIEEQKKEGRKRNLWFKSVKRFMRIKFNTEIHHKCTIQIESNHSIKDIVDILLLKLTEEFSRQCMYMGTPKELKAESQIFDVLSIRQIKEKARMYDENARTNDVPFNAHILSDYEHRFICGYRRLAKHLGFSLSYTWRFIKRMKDKNLVTTETIEKPLCTISKEEWKNKKEMYINSYQGHVYHKGNTLYSALGTVFNFTTYTI